MGREIPVAVVVEYTDTHRDRVVKGRPLGVEPTCEVLTESGVRIAPSTYYAARSRLPSARAVRDAELFTEITTVHSENLGVYGARKIHAALNRKRQDRQDRVARAPSSGSCGLWAFAGSPGRGPAGPPSPTAPRPPVPFALCCIVFLAPSYLASAVKNRRWRLLPLTFLFAAGLASILVPITVGISLIAAAIAKYHTVLYWAGGILMLVLAGFTLSGRMWSLPSFLRAPDTSRGDGASFFALGVFSGIASSCCAPVLVGVMTLSALAGNPIGGVGLGLAYVFGMVFPLFVMALVWDATGLRHKPLVAKPVQLRLGAWTLATNTVNLLVATGFAIMGGFIIYLANTGQMSSGPELKVATAETVRKWVR